MTRSVVGVDLPREVRREVTSRLLECARGASGVDREGLIEEVVLANVGVARSIAGRYARRGVPLEDLEQVSYVALIRAARKFDGGRAEDFLVYAVPTIRGEIRRWFRDQGWMVRPPRGLQELQGAVLRARAEAGSAGRELSSGELASVLGVSEGAVREALAVRGCFAPSSLDAPLSGGGSGGESGESGMVLGDVLVAGGDGRGGGAAGGGEVEACETRVMLEQAMGVLTPRERLIVRLRYVEDMTQAEIGEVIGVTQMQVSRILGKVRAVLRERLTDTEVA
jgi:RNA polymerase sigma-B factor